jgi:hypothetical protein
MEEDNLKTVDGIIQEEYWKTIDGKVIPFSEVTHQHWSNIYWYHSYLIEMSSKNVYIKTSQFFDKAKEAIFIAEKQINLRFGGEKLDWVPVYENEKEWYKSQCTRKVLIEKYIIR